MWVLICTVHLTVCYYHVTYSFQSESTLYSCMNVKELLFRNRCDIRNLSDSNGIRTQNQLVCKRTSNHLAKLFKWLSCVVSTYLYVTRVRGMVITYIQMNRTDNFSQHITVIGSVSLSGWVFVYELSGCWFESRCSHLNLRYRACFEQGVPWHSGNYRMQIHTETRTWHYNNILSNERYRYVLTTHLIHLASFTKWLSVHN